MFLVRKEIFFPVTSFYMDSPYLTSMAAGSLVLRLSIELERQGGWGSESCLDTNVWFFYVNEKTTWNLCYLEEKVRARFVQLPSCLSVFFSPLVLHFPESLYVLLILLQVIVKIDDNTPVSLIYHIFIGRDEAVGLMGAGHKYLVFFSIIRVHDYFLNSA